MLYAIAIGHIKILRSAFVCIFWSTDQLTENFTSSRTTTLCPKKVTPYTMYDKILNLNAACPKFCALDSEVLCDKLATFHLKILSDSGVINV